MWFIARNKRDVVHRCSDARHEIGRVHRALTEPDIRRVAGDLPRATRYSDGIRRLLLQSPRR
jgi:hypothetical protein